MNRNTPDKIWYYKNFNMVNELDIAGEFIYDGIHVLNQMQTVTQSAMLFSFLYHIAVGIERLQKIIIVLNENITKENSKEFEEKIKNHNHVELNNRIVSNSKIGFSQREKQFLHLLSDFYINARYNRFNVSSESNKEEKDISNYIKKHVSADSIKRSISNEVILVTDEVKEMFGRVIGSLSKKYYETLRESCNKNGTFTYELRSDSKAQKIFYSHYYKNSIQQQKVTESIAFKELVVFIKNTDKSDAMMRFVQHIEPLDIDIALIKDYIHELSQGIISQDLVDEVDYHYEGNGYSKERLEMINAIGDPLVCFEIAEVYNCFNLLDELISNKIDCCIFAKKFPIIYSYLKDSDFDDEEIDEFQELLDICNEFHQRATVCESHKKAFIEKVIPYHEKFIEKYGYLLGASD